MNVCIPSRRLLAEARTAPTRCTSSGMATRVECRTSERRLRRTLDERVPARRHERRRSTVDASPPRSLDGTSCGISYAMEVRLCYRAQQQQAIMTSAVVIFSIQCRRPIVHTKLVPFFHNLSPYSPALKI